MVVLLFGIQSITSTPVKLKKHIAITSRQNTNCMNFITQKVSFSFSSLNFSMHQLILKHPCHVHTSILSIDRPLKN